MEDIIEVKLKEQREQIINAINNMTFAFSEGEYPATVDDAIKGTRDTIAKAIRFIKF